jgi:hypothetical protein
MTSPPSRETGPTPEEQAAEEILLARVRAWKGFRDEAAEIVPILTRLVSEAKRSAHLEDARAGCEFCGPASIWGPAERVARKYDTQCADWMHKSSKSEHRVLCQRPEVWDALSLLPGGPK